MGIGEIYTRISIEKMAYRWISWPTSQVTHRMLTLC